VPAADVDEQREEHAEQGGEANGEGDRPHAAGAAPRRQAQEEAHDRRREAHLQHAEGKRRFPSLPTPSNAHSGAGEMLPSLLWPWCLRHFAVIHFLRLDLFDVRLPFIKGIRDVFSACKSEKCIICILIFVQVVMNQRKKMV
jgi:hypothetical protein